MRIGYNHNVFYVNYIGRSYKLMFCFGKYLDSSFGIQIYFQNKLLLLTSKEVKILTESQGRYL